jgi:ferritin-like metal-binding protein YciE
MRLDSVFRKLGQEPKGTDCPAIDGLIREADEVAGAVVTAFKSPGGWSAEQRTKDTLKIIEAGRRLARTVC